MAPVRSRMPRTAGCTPVSRQHTLDSTYGPKVRRWIIPQLGKHRLDRLQPEHLDAFYSWLASQGLKAGPGRGPADGQRPVEPR